MVVDYHVRLCPPRQPRVNVPLRKEHRRAGFPGDLKQVVGVESRMRGDVLVWFGEDSAYTDPVDWWKSSFTPYSKYAFSGVS
jgi:hypothetical protein